MKNLLNVQNLTMSFGIEPLYEDVGFGVGAGERIAVVGPNGCGKSTLFKLLAGELTPDSGEITFRSEISMAYLAQKQRFEAGDTPREIVSKAMQPVRDAIEEHSEISEQLAEDDRDGDAETDELIERQAHLQQRIQNIGGWSWEHRVEEMLDRLGIDEWVDEPIGRLSGGQRRRVDLARVLLQAPDLMLLDEPTNHLDTRTVEWLEHWLVEATDTLMFVTHDRYFLERIADRIIEIAPDGFYDYPGNYHTFIERKKHRREIRKRTEKRRQKELKKELEWLKGGMKASSTRSKKRVEKIKRLKNQDTGYVERDIEMPLAEPGEFSDVVLNARGIWKSHGDLQLLEGAHFDVHPGDRIGVIGPNGCGKTTLLEMLAGRTRNDAGVIDVGKKTDMAFLHQHAPLVDPEQTVYEAFSDSDYVWIGDTRYHKQTYLNHYLFDRPLQKSPIKSLSGGQKRRFAIARTFAQNPNVLLLDEPTNDLDIMSLEALESALDDWDGCVVAVSHDRYFLNRVCNTIVAFEDRDLVRYAGDYDYYRSRRDDRFDPVDQSEPGSSQADQSKSSTRETTGDSEGLSYHEEQRLETLEDEIEAAEDRRAEIEETMADPEFYDSDPERIESLNRELHELEEHVEKLWDEWYALEERRT